MNEKAFFSLCVSLSKQKHTRKTKNNPEEILFVIEKNFKAKFVMG